MLQEVEALMRKAETYRNAADKLEFAAKEIQAAEELVGPPAGRYSNVPQEVGAYHILKDMNGPQSKHVLHKVFVDGGGKSANLNSFAAALSRHEKIFSLGEGVFGLKGRDEPDEDDIPF